MKLQNKSYDSLWMVGDDFVWNTVDQMVTNSSSRFFMKDNFNVYTFVSSHTEEGTVLSRIYNNVVKAINQYVKLPKFIIIVIDSDISKNTKIPKGMGEGSEAFQQALSSNIEYLIKNIHDLIEKHKMALPIKSQKNTNFLR